MRLIQFMILQNPTEPLQLCKSRWIFSMERPGHRLNIYKAKKWPATCVLNLKAKSKRRIIKEYQIQHYCTEWTETEDMILEVFFRLPVKAFVQVSFYFKLWRPVLSPNFMRYRDRNEHRIVFLLLMNATPVWVAMRKLLIRMPVLQW
jgi:hypothetical protein